MTTNKVTFSVGAQLQGFDAERTGCSSIGGSAVDGRSLTCLDTQQAGKLDSACLRATRLAFRHRNRKVTFSEVLMVPVVVVAERYSRPKNTASAALPASDWSCVQTALDVWAPCNMVVKPLRRLMEVQHMKHWSQRDTRYLLEHSLPTGPTFRHTLTIETEMTGGPCNVSLSFLIMVASSTAGWPSRYLTSSQDAWRLRKTLGFAFSPNDTLSRFEVGVPQTAPKAIASGVSAMIASLDETASQNGWDIQLDHHDADRWWLRVETAGNQLGTFQIPLRAHLLGEQGLLSILSKCRSTERRCLQ